MPDDTLPATDQSNRPPRTAKEAAVAQWRDALADLPDDSPVADTLRDADIHDARDRRTIEDTIEFEAPTGHYTALADAFHDLTHAFDDVW